LQPAGQHSTTTDNNTCEYITITTNRQRVRFFRSLNRSDQLWSFLSRFSIASGTKVSRFLIVPEQPVSIQNCSGSIVRKPGVAGEMSDVSQSDVLFTIDGFQASW